MMTTTADCIALFAPDASTAFGSAVAAGLGTALSEHEEVEFTGAERKLRPLASVRGKSVYVVQTLFGDQQGSANDRLCQLLFLSGALKDAGAGRITACVPYFAYARQDRRVEPGDPLTARYVAQLIEAIGVDRVLALEVHNLAAFENGFRCETVHLDANARFIQHFAAGSAGHDYAVASPDLGGAKRARRFQESLQKTIGRPVHYALMDKKRSHGIVSGELFAGDVAGRRVIVIDDLVSSGTTALRAVAACRRAGAVRVDLAATHAAFGAEAHRLFEQGGPDSVVVTDSIALGSEFSAHLNTSLVVLDIAPVFAEAIRRLEAGRSPPGADDP